MMIYYHNFCETACLYQSLHVCYSILSVVKELAFPNQSSGLFITFWSCIVVVAKHFSILAVSFYVISRRTEQQLTNGRMVTILFIFIFGVVIYLTGEMQKFVTRKYEANQLIREGIFRKTRNPELFGKIMVYLSLVVFT